MVAVAVADLFGLIEKGIELYGPYDDVKRAVSHHLIGATLMPMTYRLGTNFLDSRINLMVVLPTGHGKREVTTAIANYVKVMNYAESDFAKPSTHHPQQLVGTMYETTTDDTPPQKVWVPQYGFLDKRFLVFEEAFRILSHPDEMETRQLISQALDPYMRNEIAKKNLAWPEELRYYPRCSVTMLWQPQPIPIDVWRSGLTRRFLWVVLDELTKEQAISILKQSFRTQPLNLADDVLHLANKISARVNARGPPEFIVRFDAVTGLIVEGSQSCFDIAVDHSDKCRGLPHTLKFTFAHLLMKMAANHCAANAADVAFQQNKPMIPAELSVGEDDVIAAADDLSAFIKKMVLFLDQHIELPIVTSPTGRAIQAMLRNHGPANERNLIDTLDVSGQMGSRLTAEDVRRELQILCLQGVVRLREDGMYEVVDPIV